MMDRSELELGLAISRCGTLAAAAVDLSIAPSAVTKRLAALEAQLGQRLFQRSTRRVSATSEGQTLCERAAELLAGFAALEAELQERKTEPTGVIRLAATFGFGRLWLGPTLAAFQQRYPSVALQLQLTEQLPDLAREAFDGAIWLWPVQGSQASQWVSRRLARNQRVLVAAPSYLHVNGEPDTLEALAQHRCLMVRENGKSTARSFDFVFGGDQNFDVWQLRKRGFATTVQVRVKGPMSSNSGELVRDWCLAGRGIMLRSLWEIAPQLANGQLVQVLPNYAVPDADIHWLAPYRAEVPRRIRLLIDFLVAQFESEPWQVGATRASAAARPD